jgi:hypothetical protein
MEDQLVKQNTGVLFPGSLIYYVGILLPVDRVMARSGTIGALDQEGLPLKRIHQDYDYTAHLVDCRSYTGFSGSPCFVDLPYASLKPVKPPIPYPEELGPLAELHHLGMLCGMFTAHLTDEGDDGTVSRYGVGVMLRSKEIGEALLTDDLRKDRAEKDAAAADEAEGQPSFEQTGRGGSEFANFEDLTRKLVNTPKSEVDEKRRAEKDAS